MSLPTIDVARARLLLDQGAVLVGFAHVDEDKIVPALHQPLRERPRFQPMRARGGVVCELLRAHARERSAIG